MIKELTKQEVAKKLAKEGCFEGYMWDFTWTPIKITGVKLGGEEFPICVKKKSGYDSYDCCKRCAIEVPDEYEPYPDDETPEIKCNGWIKSKCTDVEYLIICIDRDPKASLHFEFRDMCLSNTSLFEDFTWLDGSPIGRLKQ